jgi:hypothetical protein
MTKEQEQWAAARAKALAFFGGWEHNRWIGSDYKEEQNGPDEWKSLKIENVGRNRFINDMNVRRRSDRVTKLVKARPRKGRYDPNLPQLLHRQVGALFHDHPEGFDLIGKSAGKLCDFLAISPYLREFDDLIAAKAAEVFDEFDLHAAVVEKGWYHDSVSTFLLWRKEKDDATDRVIGQRPDVPIRNLQRR